MHQHAVGAGLSSPSAVVQIGGAVPTPFSGGHAVALGLDRAATSGLGGPVSIRLIEVLACILRGAVVKVVEHQVHVFFLFCLQVVVDFGIPVHFYLDVRVCLAGKGSGL